MDELPVLLTPAGAAPPPVDDCTGNGTNVCEDAEPVLLNTPVPPLALLPPVEVAAVPLLVGAKLVGLTVVADRVVTALVVAAGVVAEVEVPTLVVPLTVVAGAVVVPAVAVVGATVVAADVVGAELDEG